MKLRRSLLFLLIFLALPAASQMVQVAPAEGYEERIRRFIDTIRIFDTHEHLIDPDVLKRADFLDFSMLLLENGYNDLLSSGMPDTLFKTIFTAAGTPASKWRIIEPWWKLAFNTSNNRIMMRSVNDIYGIKALDSLNAGNLSSKMKKSYNGAWFDHIIRDICRIDYIVQDGPKLREGAEYIKYAARFNSWILMKTKASLDSLAIQQPDPIYTLESFVKSMENALIKAINNGNLAVIKVDVAYDRTLNFERVPAESAKKVFRMLVNGNEDTKLSNREAKPLQDYMLHQLMELAARYRIPVAFHTGYQAGKGNYIVNSSPALLTNLFIQYPEVNFVLFHGSYPFGGELSTLAKGFKNVFIDMNWTYDISPRYAERYLDEWLESVPVNKIMAFGGDQRMAEMTYGSLIISKQVISEVLVRKTGEGYFTEEEAKTVARMILRDNAMNFYNLK